MRVLWTIEAVTDRLAIFDHIAKDNPEAAVAIDRRFEESAVRLARFPLLGRSGLVRDTREVFPHQHYRLVYQTSDTVIVILALVHTARAWPPVPI